MATENDSNDVSEQAQGKVREAIGDETGNDRLTSEGLEQQAQASAESETGAEPDADSEKARARREADELLDDVTQPPRIR